MNDFNKETAETAEILLKATSRNSAIQYGKQHNDKKANAFRQDARSNSSIVFEPRSTRNRFLSKRRKVMPRKR